MPYMYLDHKNGKYFGYDVGIYYQAERTGLHSQT